MPPRRRGRNVRSASAASADRDQRAPQSKHTPSAVSTPTNPTGPPQDSWTTDQEIALLKLLIKNSPLGYHKHMKMLSIYMSLEAEGHTHIPSSKGAGESILREHMRIPNIWRKLAGMYDLEELDRRQNDAYDEHDHDEVVKLREQHKQEAPSQKKTGRKANDDEDEDDENLMLWKDFSPDNFGDQDDVDDLRDRMFQRRLRQSGPPSSPSAIPSQQPSTSGRPKASTRTRSMRASTGRRGSRTNTDTGDDVEMEDADGDGGDEDEQDGEDEAGEEEGDDEEQDDDDEGGDGDGEDDEDEDEPTTQTRSTRGSTRATSSVRRGKRKR